MKGWLCTSLQTSHSITPKGKIIPFVIARFEGTDCRDVCPPSNKIDLVGICLVVCLKVWNFEKPNSSLAFQKWSPGSFEETGVFCCEQFCVGAPFLLNPIISPYLILYSWLCVFLITLTRLIYKPFDCE